MLPGPTMAASVFIVFAAWRPRSSGWGNAAPPLGVSRSHIRLESNKISGHEDGVQMPGIPRPGASQRAEPHVRLRPRGMEPDPGLAASAVPGREDRDDFRPGERLPDCHESHGRTGVAERGVFLPAAAGDPPPAGRLCRVLRPADPVSAVQVPAGPAV